MRPACCMCGQPSDVNRGRFYLCARHQLAWMLADLDDLPSLTVEQARQYVKIDRHLHATEVAS